MSLSPTIRLLLVVAVVSSAALVGGCRTDRPMAQPPQGAEQALDRGYSNALHHWQGKHGKAFTPKRPRCVWMAKTQWTTDASGKLLEMGGWTLTPTAFAMWVGQHPLQGSIQHECEHCFDLQAFGKTSEESVR